MRELEGVDVLEHSSVPSTGSLITSIRVFFKALYRLHYHLNNLRTPEMGSPLPSTILININVIQDFGNSEYLWGNPERVHRVLWYD